MSGVTVYVDKSEPLPGAGLVTDKHQGECVFLRLGGVRVLMPVGHAMELRNVLGDVLVETRVAS